VRTGSRSGLSTELCFCCISQSAQRGVYASFMLTGGQTLPDSVQCLPEFVKRIWTSIVSLCLFSAWQHMAVMSWSSTGHFLCQIFYPVEHALLILTKLPCPSTVRCCLIPKCRRGIIQFQRKGSPLIFTPRLQVF